MLTTALRNTILMGIGAVSLTKERAETLVKELTDKGEVGQTEAGTFVRELIRRGEQERDAVRKTVQGEMLKLRKEMKLTSRRDLTRFETRLKRIEEHLNLPPLSTDEETVEEGTATETNPPG